MASGKATRGMGDWVHALELAAEDYTWDRLQERYYRVRSEAGPVYEQLAECTRPCVAGDHVQSLFDYGYCASCETALCVLGWWGGMDWPTV